MSFTWDDMDYWKSGEWQLVQEKLDDLDQKGLLWCPIRKNLFAALDATPFFDVKVMIVGQDPYPDRSQATGLAFSVPTSIKNIPATLGNIFVEYCNDLENLTKTKGPGTDKPWYPYPKNGSLLNWTRQGVLLWNCIPTCLVGRPGSHESLWTNWRDWHPPGEPGAKPYSSLTKEIIERLNEQETVFIFMGAKARDYARFTDDRSLTIEVMHPSPRNNIRKGQPHSFFGSRIFTTANDYLVRLGKQPVNWRL